jgi:MFS family permease
LRLRPAIVELPDATCEQHSSSNAKLLDPLAVTTGMISLYPNNMHSVLTDTLAAAPVVLPSLWLLGLALFLQAIALNGMTTIWPLLLRDWYHWGSKEFSIVLLLCSLVATIGVAAVPTLER